MAQRLIARALVGVAALAGALVLGGLIAESRRVRVAERVVPVVATLTPAALPTGRPLPVPVPTPSPSPWPTAPPGDGYEFGQAVDEGGRPIAGAVIRIEPWGIQATTDAEGRYVLRGMVVAGDCVWATWTARAPGRSLTRFDEPIYPSSGQRNFTLRSGDQVQYVGPPRSESVRGQAFCSGGIWTDNPPPHT